MKSEIRVKNIVLYGAYDRYNYGDNLMPILLEKYVKHYCEQAAEISFIYASITSSDLSKYDCLPTQPMSEVVSKLQDGDAVIVVGGEVLRASAGSLYLHVQESHAVTKAFRLANKVAPALFARFSKNRMRAISEWPYIVDPDDLPKRVKVAYNTVGAPPAASQRSTLKKASYLSVRDLRTYAATSDFMHTELVPDSVLLVSRHYDTSKLEALIRDSVREYARLQKRYIVVQACPYKIDASPLELAKHLVEIESTRNLNVVLLPIGYASGHDDAMYLDAVARAMGRSSLAPLDDLSIWEILYIISQGAAYFGTSLHGVISAMAYKVPHFCINHNLKKVTSFIETWSVSPFTQQVAPLRISQTLKLLDDPKEINDRLEPALHLAQNKIEHSISQMIKSLF